MAPLPPKRKLATNCHPLCSLREEVIGADAALFLKDARENGMGIVRFQRAAEEKLGRSLNTESIRRHLKHYREIDEFAPADGGEKPSDIAILDSIVAAGYRNSRNWKPTIRDTLDAMKLKAQMTGQSAFEDMLAAMDEALTQNEAPEAVASEEERAQVGESSE